MGAPDLGAQCATTTVLVPQQDERHIYCRLSASVQQGGTTAIASSKCGCRHRDAMRGAHFEHWLLIQPVVACVGHHDCTRFVARHVAAPPEVATSCLNSLMRPRIWRGMLLMSTELLCELQCASALKLAGGRCTAFLGLLYTSSSERRFANINTNMRNSTALPAPHRQLTLHDAESRAVQTQLPYAAPRPLQVNADPVANDKIACIC